MIFSIRRLASLRDRCSVQCGVCVWGPRNKARGDAVALRLSRLNRTVDHRGVAVFLVFFCWHDTPVHHGIIITIIICLGGWVGGWVGVLEPGTGHRPRSQPVRTQLAAAASNRGGCTSLRPMTVFSFFWRSHRGGLGQHAILSMRRLQ